MCFFNTLYRVSYFNLNTKEPFFCTHVFWYYCCMKIIDIHTHGIGGYDTRTHEPEHILKIAEIHGVYGVSEIIPTIYAAPIEEMRENIEAVRKAMEIQRQEDRRQKSKKPQSVIRNRQLGHIVPRPSSLIIGVHLEGPFLNPSRSGALNPASFLQPAEYSLKRLIEGFEDIIRIITIAPELEGAVKLMKTISDMGIIVSMGHSDATFIEAEAGFHGGAKGITHLFNAMRGFYHREPGIAGFGLLNQDIYVEVIADPFHLHQKAIEMIFKIKNPKRIIIISDSVKDSQTFSSPKSVTDNDGKLQGGSLTVTESAKRLIGMGFDEELIMQCVSSNPKKMLNRKGN